MREEGPGPVTTLLQRRDNAEIENRVPARGVPTPLCMVRPLTYKALSTQLGNQPLVRCRDNLITAQAREGHITGLLVAARPILQGRSGLNAR